MHSMAWWPILVVVVIATISDLRSRRIPNWAVVPFLLAGMITLTATQGWHGLAQSLEGVLLALLLLGILYWLGGMGMGDVKLCAAIGAWVGPGQLMLALVLMGMAGGLIALVLAIRGGFLKESLGGTGELVFGAWKRGFRSHTRLVLSNPEARKMPYAPAIAIGTILSFFAQP
jgi:prepilin peptidase CpaA